MIARRDDGHADEDRPGSGAGAASPTREGLDAEAPAPLDGERLKACLEAILFASSEPVPRKRLRSLLPEAGSRAIDEALLRLEAELVSGGRAFSLVEEAAGLRLLTRAEFAPYVARLAGEKRAVRLSQAAFETLAVIAYRQPIRRADLESVRGVQCGAILKTLLDWSLIQVVGQHESLGRPLLYGTTAGFLEQFGLARLEDLPAPDRLRSLAREQGLEIESGSSGAEAMFGAGGDDESSA